MPSPDHIRATVERYMEALGRHDKDAWLACFADDVVHLDPVGSPPNVGRQAVSDFWDAMIGQTEQVAIDIERFIVCASDGVVVGTLRVRPKGGPTLTVELVEVFTIDDDGRIAEQRAWWDPAQMRPVEESA